MRPALDPPMISKTIRTSKIWWMVQWPGRMLATRTWIHSSSAMRRIRQRCFSWSTWYWWLYYYSLSLAYLQSLRSSATHLTRLRNFMSSKTSIQACSSTTSSNLWPLCQQWWLSSSSSWICNLWPMRTSMRSTFISERICKGFGCWKVPLDFRSFLWSLWWALSCRRWRRLSKHLLMMKNIWMIYQLTKSSINIYSPAY